MQHSLLFIPDISGFTHFVQTTEAEHSQHVIAELLEILIDANRENLQLAEIEGDALFFYKENEILSQERLLAQIETMFTAFYSHLKKLEKHRICPCMACSSAKDLELKIVVHCGALQFIEVKGNRKPFGEEVIQAHRLLKNSVPSDNYVLISKTLAEGIMLTEHYKSTLFDFQKGSNTYDEKEIAYLYSNIAVENLKIPLFEKGYYVEVGNQPNLTFERDLEVSSKDLLEFVTNYKHRHLWAIGADEIHFNSNEVTRLGSEHLCVVGSQHLDFKVVTKEVKEGEWVYGEETKSPPFVDVLYQFYIIRSVSENRSHLKVETYWKVNSPFKKLFVSLVAKKQMIKNVNASLDALKREVESSILSK